MDPQEEIKVEIETPKKEKSKAKIIIINIVVAILLTAASSYFSISYVLKRIDENKTTVVINQNVYGEKTEEKKDNDLSTVIESVYDTVVEVYTEITQYSTFYGSYVTNGAGSGVILSEDGYIVTNEHVVDSATSVKVKTSDGKEYDAQLIASDTIEDLAILKIEATGLHPVTIGSSNDLKVGELCIAIGNPLGTLGGTVTDGIISALSRQITVEKNYMTLLQTNASINPGNSGGGLFNKNGELIGIVNAKSSSENVEGIGFAIPIDTAMNVINELLTDGEVTTRPALNISCLDIDNIALAWAYGLNSTGVYVTEIRSSKLGKEGLKVKDMIIGIDSKTVSSVQELKSIIATYKIGDTVTLHVLRNKQNIDVDVVLEEKIKD